MDNSIINWDNVFSQKENFMNSKPFKFTFIENIFEANFYEKLYETYPKLDDSWIKFSNFSKSQLGKYWGKHDTDIVSPGTDITFSKEWNELKLYTESEEFLSNFRKLTGTTVNRLKNFQFMSYKKGGFQLPHIHNVGPNTIILMLYFSKGWKKGDPGGTYMANDVDESEIIFEPYNLDNSLALFQDSSKAAHGVRIITKDVERRGVQIYLEDYDDENGWSGVEPQSQEFQSKLPEI
tara:strand:+ start:167 stop:874 length:708 start_codon:yes stop_codon:yes gene_type:complete